jgi:hypothetical protein
MAIQRTEIDGRWATMADMPGGYIEVVFDDGERVVLAELPVEDAAQETESVQ